MENFLAALAGGIIAGAASIITMVIQMRGERRRAKARRALEAATSEYQSVLEHATPGAQVAPLSAWVLYYSRLEDLMEQGGPISAEGLREIEREMQTVVDVAEE